MSLGAMAAAIPEGEMASWTALDPLVPFSLEPGAPDRAIATMREIKARCGIRRFLVCSPGRTCRIHGCYDVSVYEQVARDLKKIREALEPEGFMLGYMYTVTFKIGDNPFTHIRGLNGKEASACPLDPAFRQWTMNNLRAIAGAGQPHLMALEDDYQLTNQPLVYEEDSWGCFCDRHLAEFSRREGKAYTLDDLRREFAKNTDEAFELRKRWGGMVRDSLVDFAKLVAKTVHEVSPNTRLGLLECGCDERDGLPTDGVAKALADGRTRPWVRYHGAFYHEDRPYLIPQRLFHKLYTVQHYDPVIERFDEQDTCPFDTFYASAARTETMISMAMLYGFDQSLYSCCTALIDGTVADEPAYLDLWAKNAKRFEAIRTLGKAGEVVADFEVVHHPDAIMAHAYKGRGNQFGFDKPWVDILGRYGVPYTTAGGKVKVISGFMELKNRPKEEILKLLSGPVAMDGEAAEFLTEQGYGEYLGVTVEPQGKIDFWMEEVADDVDLVRDLAKKRVFSSSYMPFGLDGLGRCARLKAAKGAKTVSWLLAPQTNARIRAGTTVFENALGGKVAVFALWFDSCRAPNLFSEPKRQLMYRVFDWLGADGVRVLDRKNVFTTAVRNRADGSLAVTFVNLLADVQPSVRLRVPAPWKGGKVELLDGARWVAAPAAWDGDALAVSTELAIMKPVVVRVGGRVRGRGTSGTSGTSETSGTSGTGGTSGR